MPCFADNSIYLDKYKKITVKNGVLQGGISSSKELPEEFYGTWSVSGTMIETNNRILFGDKSSDIWILSKDQDIITLTNPTSGASASITVNAVKGKKATFSRKKDTKNHKEYEKVTITVDNENFYGSDEIIIEEYRNGTLVQTSMVEYDVVGSKLSGPPIRDIFSE